MPTIERPESEITVASPDELRPDKNNANRGTPRGRKALKNSLRKLGAGRSILTDKNGVILAGNKTYDEAIKQGIPITRVKTDGKTLVVVQRTDLEVGDKKAQELAIADNRVAELDLSWDANVLGQPDLDLTGLFEPNELGLILNNGKGSKVAEKIDMQKPPKMLWVLLGIPFNRFDAVQEHLAALESDADINVQSARDKMNDPDPRNDVIRVFLRRCMIHPAEMPLPGVDEKDPPPAGPNLDQFQNPRPTSGQRALDHYWRT